MNRARSGSANLDSRVHDSGAKSEPKWVIPLCSDWSFANRIQCLGYTDQVFLIGRYSCLEANLCQ